MPAHGWTCFHCGETFTTPGSARDHFGTHLYDKPGCLLKVEVGEERGLLMELRKAQAKIDELRSEQMTDRQFYWRLECDLQYWKPFRGCKSLQDVFNRYDSMEGRALAAEEREAQLRRWYSETIGSLAPERMESIP
jgi:hypothetical protein